VLAERAALLQYSTMAHVPALTSLRFVAALWVVLYHLHRFRHAAGVVDEDGFVDRVVAAGPAAVSFFFVLSGYVLGRSALDDNGALRLPVRAFYARRLRRLLPAHLLAWAVALPVAVVIAHKAAAVDDAPSVWPGALASLFFVQAWWPSLALAHNAPAWSLSVEVFFYAVFPVVAPRLLRLPPWPAFAALWLASALPGVVAVVVDADAAAATAETSSTALSFLKFHPLVRLPELCAGVVLARWVRQAALVGAGAFVVGVAGILAVAALGLPSLAQHNGLLLPLFALVIAAASSTTFALSSVGRALAWRPWVLLGDASYALYALHVPLLFWVAGVGERRTGTKVLASVVVDVVAVVAIVVVAVVVYVAVERPLCARRRGPT
jgi:peptidoglycan/LPS O-acetylase OafA/YrhL